MLVVLSQFKFTQLTRLWLMITFTIYLSNKLTFSLTRLIHVLSLLTTAYLFKARDLTSQFTQVMQSIGLKLKMGAKVSSFMNRVKLFG